MARLLLLRIYLSTTTYDHSTGVLTRYLENEGDE